MNVVRMAMSGTIVASARASPGTTPGLPAPHLRQDRARHVLERDVHVGEKAGVPGHELQDGFIEGFGIRVEEADPGKRRLREEPLDQVRQPVSLQSQVFAVAGCVL
jgi:hypothetical protein